MIANQAITARGATKEVRHIEVNLAGSGLTYEPGDALGVWHENPPLVVNDVLQALRLDGEQPVELDGATKPLREWLATKRELTRLTRPFLAQQAERSQDAGLAAVLQPGHEAELRHTLKDLQVVDVLQRHPGEWDAKSFVQALRPLAPRLYSIASSQEAVGEEAHLTVALVDYTLDRKHRVGAASRYLASLQGEDAKARVFIEHNERFRLPADTSRDVIMIGPGTGVAPFRGFVQHREAQGATGRNWLFFGARHFQSEFLYQAEWQDAVKKGVLNRLDLAFSRDRSIAREYVQDRLRRVGKDLYAWLENGAYLYVCGDADKMAPGREHGPDRHRRRARRQDRVTTLKATCASWRTTAATCATCTDARASMTEQSPVERIKRESRNLRGTLIESLADPLTGAIREDDTVLIKFHGSYQQDDRDIRDERRRQKLEPAYSFMIRTRCRAASARRAQWLQLDADRAASTRTARCASPRARRSSSTA